MSKRPISEEDAQYVYDNYPDMTRQQIADVIGRSINTVKYILKNRGKHWGEQRSTKKVRRGPAPIPTPPQVTTRKATIRSERERGQAGLHGWWCIKHERPVRECGLCLDYSSESPYAPASCGNCLFAYIKGASDNAI